MTLTAPTTTARAICPACKEQLRLPLTVTPEGRNVLVVSADPEEIRAYFDLHCAEAPEKHGGGL